MDGAIEKAGSASAADACPQDRDDAVETRSVGIVETSRRPARFFAVREQRFMDQRLTKAAAAKNHEFHTMTISSESEWIQVLPVTSDVVITVDMEETSQTTPSPCPGNLRGAAMRLGQTRRAWLIEDLDRRGLLTFPALVMPLAPKKAMFACSWLSV